MHFNVKPKQTPLFVMIIIITITIALTFLTATQMAETEFKMMDMPNNAQSGSL